MISVGKKSIVTALILSSGMINVAWADEAAMTQRIDRLERIIKGQGLVTLLGRVDQLQNEVQRLKGDNESLRHEIEKMQKRQRDLYLDIDQRIEEQAKNTAVPALTSVPTDGTVQTDTLANGVESSESQTTAPQVDSSEQLATQPVSNAPVSVENGEAAYQAALQTLRSGQYEQAITALSAFPDQYPQSSYLPNAYYWQGEANYVLRNFDSAVTAFQTVIERFPSSTKVADATLKLGFSQYELGKITIAMATLESVVSNYPNTSAARLAKVRLDRIKQENR